MITEKQLMEVGYVKTCDPQYQYRKHTITGKPLFSEISAWNPAIYCPFCASWVATSIYRNGCHTIEYRCGTRLTVTDTACLISKPTDECCMITSEVRRDDEDII